jgi:hypothetical protein
VSTVPLYLTVGLSASPSVSRLPKRGQNCYCHQAEQRMLSNCSLQFACFVSLVR